ncbi:1-aminocyclopropane-1-carboxylate deaminase/D-cysteine desulfhydrase [Fibrobacterota bacterium]
MSTLFAQFPGLKTGLPHLPLGAFPTPVQKLERFGRDLGLAHLYIKRDDLSARLYGGNKIRKLEFVLGSALRNRAREVITFGCAGSNHALATAIYARQTGLKSVSMLLPQPNALSVRGNLLAQHYFGAELHHYENEKLLKTDLDEALHRHKGKGLPAPEVIPAGGSSVLGAAGFVGAGFELRSQVEEGLIPEPDLIYVASGTMGTCVGLKLGLKAAGLMTQVVPVRVAGLKFSNEKKMMAFYGEISSLLHSADPSFPELGLPEGDAGLRHDFFGAEYARFTKEGNRAVMYMKEKQGIRLEGTYTGKTLAALIHDAQRQELKHKVVLFWNTYNSRPLPEEISAVDYRELPEGFHRYFKEDVQEL